MKFETENIEFKEKFTEEIYKEVIAFANTDGGIVYVGIDDNGNAVGLDNVKEDYVRITNGIRDAIKPDVTMFIKYTLQDNGIVSIKVSEGTNKPYYLSSKGIKPNGVYVRQGTSSSQASWEQIRNMIKDTDGDIYEEMRSLNQDLTFHGAEQAFKKFNVEFSTEKYLSLGIIDKDGMFTNLGLLLSDQCQHTTKVAVFSDDDNTIFRDKKEFTGSILKQLQEVYTYLQFCNRTASVYSGLERIDITDYPEFALREAFINSLVHRDYSISASNIININDKNIEFINFGSLMSGMSVDDLQSGISFLRNKNLAQIIFRFKLIEAYGTGVRKIYKIYNKFEKKPEILNTTNVFKLVLPNINVSNTVEKNIENNIENNTNAVNDVVKEENAVYITSQMKEVLKYISDNGYITDEGIKKILQVKQTRVYILTKQMCDMGIIKKIGRGSNKKYISTNV